MNSVTLHRLLFPVFSLAVLAGLFLLGHLFNAFQSEGLSPTQALLSEIGSAPLSWGYALGSGLLFVGFLAWVPAQLPTWRLLRRFRHVDSATLDNDPELCQVFYRALLDFHARYGEKQFMQRIACRFNFFYEYHRDALHWMNNITRDAVAAAIPANMILDSICSGHLGRVYAGCCYGGGLPSAFVSLDEPVYLLARMDSVEIWSASSRIPISVFAKHTLQAVTDQAHPQYTSVSLRGEEKASNKPRQLELRIPTLSPNNPDHEQTTPQNKLATLHAWLAALLPASADYALQENYGIDVEEISSLETPGPRQIANTPLLDMLQQMLGHHIDAVFSHGSLTISDPVITQSTIVLCSGLGIITVVDVPLAGTIYYSGKPDWTRRDADGEHRFDNACLAAQRSKTALLNRLTDAGLNSWPVHCLAVFSHGDAQPELELGWQQVQCDVITLGQLSKWFASQSADDRIRFTKDDYNEFITLLDPARLQSTRVRHA